MKPWTTSRKKRYVAVISVVAYLAMCFGTEGWWHIPAFVAGMAYGWSTLPHR